MIRMMLFITFIGLTALSVASVRLLPSKSSFISFASNPNNTFVSATTFPTSSPIATSSPIPSPSATPSSTPTPAPTPISGLANHIVISEVQIAGANVNQDFVELYNPTNNSIDVSGWKIRVRGSTGTETSLLVISASKSIPAHGYFLWANNQSGYSTSIGADESNTNNIGQNNSIALKTNADVLVDQFGWGSGTSQFVEGSLFSPSTGASQSAERKAYSTSTASTMNGGVDSDKGNGFDSDNNVADFVLRTTAQPQNSGSPIEIP